MPSVNTIPRTTSGESVRRSVLPLTAKSTFASHLDLSAHSYSDRNSGRLHLQQKEESRPGHVNAGENESSVRTESERDRLTESEPEYEKPQEKGPVSGSQPIAAVVSDLSTLPARSVFHVADIERIVASVRMQKNSEGLSVTISLRHSVFEGLEFKVSFEKHRGITAELIAPNEAVKAAIADKMDALKSILAERGVDLGSLDISMGDNSSSESFAGSPGNHTLKRATPTADPEPLTPDETGLSYLS